MPVKKRKEFRPFTTCLRLTPLPSSNHAVVTKTIVLGVLFALPLLGCGGRQSSDSKPVQGEPQGPARAHFEVKSVEYYEGKLHDKTFIWNGPASQEVRIPVLHAARALAYIGDPAVPALFRAVRDRSVDIHSIEDALDEIGLPAYKYIDDLHHRNPRSLEKWWNENREKTMRTRSDMRIGIGLPPIPRT